MDDAISYYNTQESFSVVSVSRRNLVTTEGILGHAEALESQKEAHGTPAARSQLNLKSMGITRTNADSLSLQTLDSLFKQLLVLAVEQKRATEDPEQMTREERKMYDKQSKNAMDRALKTDAERKKAEKKATLAKEVIDRRTKDNRSVPIQQVKLQKSKKS